MDVNWQKIGILGFHSTEFKTSALTEFERGGGSPLAAPLRSILHSQIFDGFGTLGLVESFFYYNGPRVIVVSL